MSAAAACVGMSLVFFLIGQQAWADGFEAYASLFGIAAALAGLVLLVFALPFWRAPGVWCSCGRRLRPPLVPDPRDLRKAGFCEGLERGIRLATVVGCAEPGRWNAAATAIAGEIRTELEAERATGFAAPVSRASRFVRGINRRPRAV